MSQNNQLPNKENKREAVQTMFDSIAPRYDLLNRILTFRLDVRWRKKAIASLNLNNKSTILDLACGTGDFAQALKKKGHTVIGIDLSLGMLKNSPHDLDLIQGDLLKLPIQSESVDAAVCGYALRNLTDLKPFFEELHRTFKTQSRIALLDVSTPDNRFLKFGHNLYFNKIVPKIGGLISNKKAYSYLPASVSYLPPRSEMLEMLRSAGFTDIEHKQLTGGISQLITATRA